MKKFAVLRTGFFHFRVVAIALCAAGAATFAILGLASQPSVVRAQPEAMPAKDPRSLSAPASTDGWSIVTSPDIYGSSLNGIACVSASDCWAVGSYISQNGAGPMLTLIEHWNGTAWSVVQSPNQVAAADGVVHTNTLSGVACLSSSQCWAVGYSYNYLYHSQDFGSFVRYRTLVERWDGASWSIVTADTVDDSTFDLAIACSSASQCWTVGYQEVEFEDTSGNLLDSTAQWIDRWNGSSWSPGSDDVPGLELNGVACASGSDCWSVGYTTSQPLIDHWNGSSWTHVAVPSTPSSGLFGVTCNSSSDCWAVGRRPGTQYYMTLTERWNGSAWSIVSSPNTSPTESNFLNSVACASSSNCWTVGDSYNASGRYKTLTEQWNGNAWSIVASPNSKTTENNFLTSVTCVSPTQCWAVGYHQDARYAPGVVYGTLIEKYSPFIPAVQTIGSRKVHPGAATFDVDLLAAPRGIECRLAGFTGTSGVDHKIIFTFINAIANCGSASVGSLSSGPLSNQCTVDLSGVANAQSLTVTLSNVLDVQNNTGNVPITIGVLAGDTNGDGVVNSADISQTKMQSGRAVDATNFREDVAVSGSINSADISAVKSKSGTALP